MTATLRINGPSLFGVRPGHPFHYAVPVSGEGGREYAARGLPRGLDLNPQTGLIQGKLSKRGTWNCVLRVKAGGKRASKKFKIICGEEICLTPPLGWNSWNCWGSRVTQQNIADAAQSMARNLKDFGWSYVNIDDGWQGRREKGGPLQPNGKFPDMAALARSVHALGLKIGIYSSPWITTYAGYGGGSADNAAGRWTPKKNYEPMKRLGKHRFAVKDAKQWARWGMDYLKYDWHPNDVHETARMAKALRASGRDVVLSLSNTLPVEDADTLTALANCWRTTGDIVDHWDFGKVSRGSYLGVMDIWRQHVGWERFQRPGHFNDADMLVLGRVGWGNPKPTRLSREEQRSHFSLWVLFASPLLLGCEMSKLDSYTRSLLCNPDVLEVHQDSLGRQASYVYDLGDREVFSKPLEDGSLALGLFNPHRKREEKVGVSFKELGIGSRQRVRDLWSGRDLGVKKGEIKLPVAGHGVRLLRVGG